MLLVLLMSGVLFSAWRIVRERRTGRGWCLPCLLALAGAVLGCPLIGGGWTPHVGVSRSDLGLQRSIVLELPEEIFDLVWEETADSGGGPAALLVVTAGGAYRLDRDSGERSQVVRFQIEESVFRARTARSALSGERSYAGLAWRRNGSPSLVVFDDAGRLEGEIPDVSSEFAFGSFGGGELKVAVERSDGKSVGIFGLSGHRAEVLSFPLYVADLGVVDPRADGVADLLVYLYPNRDGGGTFQVRGGGWRAEPWDVPAFSSFSVLPAETSRPRVLYPVRDGFAIADYGSPPQEILGCPDAHRFAYTHAAFAGDFLMVLVSGGGYLSAHMLCLFDGEGRLVYREVGEGHAYDLLPVSEGDAAAFLVPVGSRVVRYEVPGG